MAQNPNIAIFIVIRALFYIFRGLFIQVMTNLSPKSSLVLKHVLYGLALCLFWVLTSCSVTKNVPDGSYLLNESEVRVNSKYISSSELKSYLKQQPNAKILGFKFHLRMYNIPRRRSNNNAIGRWFKRVGEEPVIFDTLLMAESSKNLMLYLKSKGYYNAQVTDTVYFFKKRANTIYRVKANSPIIIGKLSYSIEDSLINALVCSDSANSLIEIGRNFDLDLLQSERERVEKFLMSNGYYNFSKDFIRFTADTTFSNRRVSLTLMIKNPMLVDKEGNRTTSYFKRYRIKNVFIFPNYDPIGLMSKKIVAQLDTVSIDGINYVYSGDPGITLDVIARANHIHQGMMYSTEEVNRTKNSLSALKMYKYVNILFAEERSEAVNSPLLTLTQPSYEDLTEGFLNCVIQLSKNTLQSYQFDVMGTNTSGALGAEGTFNYQHKNLFHGAEVFDFRLRGMFESNAENSLKNFELVKEKWTREIGGSVTVNFPKYIGFFPSKNLITRNNITTQILASYSYQNRPQFRRNMSTMQYGYKWNSSRYISHTINPVEINAIGISNLDSAFNAELSESILKYSYIDQIVTVSSYGFTFNNQNVKKDINYIFFRFNLEFSGNILNLAYRTLNIDKDPVDDTYKLFKTSFSQFVRSDINLTYHHVVNKNNTFAYRLFFGIGIPYGNSKALPFEKRYYSGGANGIRAWQARDLGPGSAYQNDRYPNQTADVKIEMNVEYRFRIVEKVEGALFIDAGNVWSLPNQDAPENETFRFKKFYEQIAVGSGLGIRLNLGFFTLRADFGYKVFDPAVNPETEYNPWIPFQRKFSWSDQVNFNFGIGYPF